MSDPQHYFVGGQRHVVRDPARTDAIEDIEFASHVLRGDRLETLRVLAQQFIDEHYHDALKESDDAATREWARRTKPPRRSAVVVRVLDGGRR